MADSTSKRGEYTVSKKAGGRITTRFSIAPYYVSIATPSVLLRDAR